MTLIFRSFFVKIFDMILESFTPLQILFLILTPIVVALLLFVFVVVPVTRKKRKKNFKEYCYKAIYKIAFDEDYYLINNYVFRADTDKLVKIDHILFGNKYMYAIIDTYFDGDLIGNENDKSLIVINNRNEKFYTENQYNVSKTLVKYVSHATGIDQDMFIGIVCVNNNCKIGVNSSNKQFYLIQRNKLKRLIRAIESRNVGNINAEQLEKAVKAIDESNKSKKKKKQQ